MLFGVKCFGVWCSVFGAWRLFCWWLFVVVVVCRCVLLVDCWLLGVVCCLMFVAVCLLVVGCCVLFVVG